MGLGTPQVFAADDVTGEWQITVDFTGRPMLNTLSLSKKADGTLEGTWGWSPVSNVKFDGQKLTFVRTVRFGDQEFTLNYAGTLKDGKLIYTHPADPFNILMQVSFGLGLVLASPVIGYQIWAFLSPALHAHEKKAHIW